LFLVKPSHYDDDGYVIQWWRSAIPSNTLAVLYGLALDCRERRVLGEDVDIEITALDETNTRIRPDRVARSRSRASCGATASRSPSAASTSPAASPCCPKCRTI
jgi:hypothetical protein